MTKTANQTAELNTTFKDACKSGLGVAPSDMYRYSGKHFTPLMRLAFLPKFAELSYDTNEFWAEVPTATDSFIVRIVDISPDEDRTVFSLHLVVNPDDLKKPYHLTIPGGQRIGLPPAMIYVDFAAYGVDSISPEEEYIHAVNLAVTRALQESIPSIYGLMSSSYADAACDNLVGSYIDLVRVEGGYANPLMHMLTEQAVQCGVFTG